MKRGMTDGAAAIGRIPGRLAKIRMQLRTIMIAICELAVAMFVIRLIVFLYGSGMSVRLEGSNASIGFDVVAEDQIYPFGQGVHSIGQVSHRAPYERYRNSPPLGLSRSGGLWPVGSLSGRDGPIFGEIGLTSAVTSVFQVPDPERNGDLDELNKLLGFLCVSFAAWRLCVRRDWFFPYGQV